MVAAWGHMRGRRSTGIVASIAFRVAPSASATSSAYVNTFVTTRIGVGPCLHDVGGRAFVQPTTAFTTVTSRKTGRSPRSVRRSRTNSVSLSVQATMIWQGRAARRWSLRCSKTWLRRRSSG